MKKYFHKLMHLLKWAVLLFFSTTIFAAIIFRFIPPPVTPLMIIRYFQNDEKSGGKQIKKNWTSIENISPNMILAVVAAEDNNFAIHHGFDWESIGKAVKHNQRHKRIRGASTISQQTAKNLFLWPARSYLRKGLEFYFTGLIEIFWSKERIMEMYLNIIETGKGIYGVETASQIYFHKPASQLNRSEAAMIAAILPRPLKRNPAYPSSYLVGRQAKILELMNMVGKVEL
jgi:monofunctional glycosyltransferase